MHTIIIKHRHTTTQFEASNILNWAKQHNSATGHHHAKCAHWSEAEAIEYINNLGQRGAEIHFDDGRDTLIHVGKGFSK